MDSGPDWSFKGSLPSYTKSGKKSFFFPCFLYEKKRLSKFARDAKNRYFFFENFGNFEIFVKTIESEGSSDHQKSRSHRQKHLFGIKINLNDDNKQKKMGF